LHLVALTWIELDLRDETDGPWFESDPAEMIDALGLILAIAERPEWHASAACRGKGTVVSAPTRAMTSGRRRLSARRARCGRSARRLA
jgi:hypothetical protein